MFERRRVENVPPVVTHKWSPDVVDEGFIPFPKRLLRCLSELFTSVADIQVVLAVVDYARPNLSRLPSYDFLAFTAGLSVPIFKERIEALEKRGWVTVAGPDQSVMIKLDGLLERIVKQTDDESRQFGTDPIF